MSATAEVMTDDMEDMETDELLEQFEEWMAASTSEDDIIVTLHEDHDLTFPQAVNRLRKLKKLAGLTRTVNKSEDVRDYIQEKHDANVDRTEIITGLVDTFGYTEKSAASTYSIQGKKLGIIGSGAGGTRVPLEDTVKFMRANEGLPKAEFLEKMKAELGYAESTCNAFYIYMPMAKEWSAQANG